MTPRLFLLPIAVLGLAACTGTGTGTTNVITHMYYTGVALRPNSCFGEDGRPPPRHCSEAEIAALRFVAIGKEITVYPEGKGTCARATIDFGDGTPPSVFVNVTPQSGTNPYTWTATHTYTGWPGKKLIRIDGGNTCLGTVSQEVTVGYAPDGREDYRAGLCAGGCNVPVTSVCMPVPMPPIRRGTGVRITTDGQKINYGGTQLFDASGDPAAPVPSGYVFPRRKKFSVVYRIGTSDYQGEAGPVAFVASQTGPLELCVNDNPNYLSDNRGGMLFTITVNERSAQ